MVNDAEAATVRHIFRRYAELGSVRLLQRELNTGSFVSKKRYGPAGQRWGNKPFARGALYLMLQNRIYRGEIVHKEKSYPGEHAAIIEADLWDTAQRRLLHNRVERRVGAGAAEPSLLAGLMYDETGQRMTPSHAKKAGRRYRYYVSRPQIAGDRSAAPAGRRIPAGDIEQLVADRLCGFLACEPDLHQAIEPDNADAAAQRALIERAAELARSWETLAPAERIKVLQTLCARIDLHEDRLDLHLAPERLPSRM